MKQLYDKDRSHCISGVTTDFHHYTFVLECRVCGKSAADAAGPAEAWRITRLSPATGRGVEALSSITRLVSILSCAPPPWLPPNQNIDVQTFLTHRKHLVRRRVEWPPKQEPICLKSTPLCNLLQTYWIVLWQSRFLVIKMQTRLALRNFYIHSYS